MERYLRVRRTILRLSPIHTTLKELKLVTLCLRSSPLTIVKKLLSFLRSRWLWFLKHKVRISLTFKFNITFWSYTIIQTFIKVRRGWNRSLTWLLLFVWWLPTRFRLVLKLYHSFAWLSLLIAVPVFFDAKNMGVWLAHLFILIIFAFKFG